MDPERSSLKENQRGTVQHLVCKISIHFDHERSLDSPIALPGITSQCQQKAHS